MADTLFSKNNNWQRAILQSSASIQEAIRSLEETSVQIVLVVDHQNKFIGTLSDGDIRRGLLKGASLDSAIEVLINRSALVVPKTVSRELILQLMAINKIRQIPIISEDNDILGLHLWDDVSVTQSRSNIMVIMAGGKGTRLRPYTETCPKPMLNVGGKPMLEHILVRAKVEGISNFLISINYLGHMIEDYFGCGERFGVSISYIKEDMPLGTAGALSLIDDMPNEPLIITNGDVITDIRYGDLIDFHLRYGAAATMAVSLHEWQNPFGVVKMAGVDIVGYEEKPVTRTHINAGVYVLAPNTLLALKKGETCDMPTLFDRLKGRELKIIAYPMHEPWLDVGRPDDLVEINRIINHKK